MEKGEVKLMEGRFSVDIRWKFLTQRTVRLSQLPREAVDAPSLEIFKARLCGALTNKIQWKVSLAHCRTVVISRSKHKPFYALV